MRNFSPVSEMKKGRGYWLETASSGAKFEKLSKYDETQSCNFCAFHSFGNSYSCVTAVKWDAYDMENTADKSKTVQNWFEELIPLSSRWQQQQLGGPCHIACYAGYFFFSQAARGQWAHVFEISPFAIRKNKQETIGLGYLKSLWQWSPLVSFCLPRQSIVVFFTA